MGLTRTAGRMDKDPMTRCKEEPTGRVRLARPRSGADFSSHLWIYAGQVEGVAGTSQPGDVVDVYTHEGKFFARGLFNPRSKIQVRILTFQEEPIDDRFWSARVDRSVALRARVVRDTDAYRVVHGEADLLPGLVVDRYADVLVMQALAAGMDRRRDFLADLLLKATGAERLYLRNDPKSRTLEGLPLERAFLRGGGETTVEIYEHGATFRVDFERGQKTGWFCDQRDNRIAAASFAKDADVLEVFCHTGAFGIHAARNGARSVEGYDVSADALALARDHAAMNGVEGRCAYRESDAFDALLQLDREGRRFDLVILDPPAFARSRQAVAHALAGYKDINLRALRVLRPDGFLVTCSCSYHVSEDQLWHAIVDAARDARKQLRLIESRSQGRDHPVLASMPETRYLKCFILQVL